VKNELLGKKGLKYTIMWFLSDRFGWTPKQIRDMSIDDINYYLQVEKTKSQVEKYLEKKHARK